jgi:hypothetical protein
VPALNLHLPTLCEYIVRGERYKYNETSFRMQTVAENSARIALDRTSITLRLPELEYLLVNLTVLANQLARYKFAEIELLVAACVQNAALVE